MNLLDVIFDFLNRKSSTGFDMLLFLLVVVFIALICYYAYKKVKSSFERSTIIRPDMRCDCHQLNSENEFQHKNISVLQPPPYSPVDGFDIHNEEPPPYEKATPLRT